MAHGNPKAIRNVSDLARKEITLVNRESGAAARMLLDLKMKQAGMMATQVQGYQYAAVSHFDVARHVAEGRADVGVGVLSAADLFGLDFLPLQEERYDLVIPTQLLKASKGRVWTRSLLVHSGARSKPWAVMTQASSGKVQLFRVV